MTTHCQRPCPRIAAIAHDRNAICGHLLDGAFCTDSWLALAELVETDTQRLDCYERAHRLVPGDREVELAMLEVRCRIFPQDAAAAARARELRALRAIEGARPNSWRPRDPAPSLGALLMREAGVTESDLRRALELQRSNANIGARKLLGDLLVERGIIAPEALVRILMQQFQERRLRAEGPYSVGEHLVIIGAITEEQLEAALLAQTVGRTKGRREQLGALLVASGAVDDITLQRAVDMLNEASYHLVR